MSRIPRFMGHTITEVPYNVAQHSIYVAQLIELALKDSEIMCGVKGWTNDGPNTLHEAVSADGHFGLLLHALLHDAHEAYLGDIPSPVKRIPELQKTFTLLELKLDHAIRSAFRLPEPSVPSKNIIHYFDKLAQAIEGYQFMHSRGLNWKLPTPTLQLLQKFPAPMTAFQSYQAFLERFEYLAEQ